MKYLSIAFIFLLSLCSFALAQADEINIVPMPKSLQRTSGDFKLNRKTKINAADETGRKSAGVLNDLLMKNYGFKLEYTDTAAKNNVIVFAGQSVSANNAAAESYSLKVSPQKIQIGGNDTGQFYAIQSLMQLLPVDFKGDAKIPAVDIMDEPRFGYRGSMLDTSRHFMPVEAIKKHLDLMSQYKFNRFHWHLTDDQGWRIEIKKYPKLTEIGSKRKESHEGRYSPIFKGDGRPIEGFYTQEQIKDVVAYAKERKITIIPEIELPGHASAALAAYPELGAGCKDNYDYQVKMTWGIFKEVFCPTDKTFQFLEDVLAETIQLFPESPYVHIGGDEVLKDFWKESAFVQDLMKKENLKDEHEVQSYFVRRIEKFVNSKGKKIIGWDEILEGGVAPNATIMSWRGEKGGIESAKAKHDVIMTPNTYLYFDYGQGDPAYEPLNIGSFIPLEKVYSYDPHPKELTEDEKKYILGAQANLWTEYIETPEKAQYMLFPRLMALSEVNWSPVEAKNYEDFTRRLQKQYQVLDKQNVNYRIPAPSGLQNILTEQEKTRIELGKPLLNGKVFYTLDGSEPTEKSEEYKKPFEITLKEGEKKELKTIVVNGKGRKSSIYAATVMRRKPLQGVDVPNKTAGVNLKFYKGNFKSVKDLDSATPAEAGETKSIMLPQFAKKTNDLKDAFGAQFEGYFYAPEEAIYEFDLETDDGATLQIGESILIDLDNVSTKTRKSDLIPLAQGYHRFILRYFQKANDAALDVRYAIKGRGLVRVYGGELFK